MAKKQIKEEAKRRLRILVESEDFDSNAAGPRTHQQRNDMIREAGRAAGTWGTLDDLAHSLAQGNAQDEIDKAKKAKRKK